MRHETDNQFGNVQEENEAEEEVLDGVASVMAVALRRWGDGAMPYVEPLMPAVGQVRPAGDRSDDTQAVCLRCHAARIGLSIPPQPPHAWLAGIRGCRLQH